MRGTTRAQGGSRRTAPTGADAPARRAGFAGGPVPALLAALAALALGFPDALPAWGGAESRESVAAQAPDGVAGQDPAEAIMIAAGGWVLERLPPGSSRLDPHRSGAGKDAPRIGRVARALGAELATLDETRQCTDAVDRSTCQLAVARLLAIGAPAIDGDQAVVKVYAWYRSGSAGARVAEKTWQLRLHRLEGGWVVASGG